MYQPSPQPRSAALQYISLLYIMGQFPVKLLARRTYNMSSRLAVAGPALPAHSPFACEPSCGLRTCNCFLNGVVCDRQVVRGDWHVLEAT